MEASHRPKKSATKYIPNLILNSARAHRAKYTLALVILGGDMNTRPAALEPWAVTHGLESAVDPLVLDADRFKTFWGFNLPTEEGWSGMSWIDHILSYSPSLITPVRVTLGQGPYWVSISDHRPLTTWFTGPSISMLGGTTPCTKDPPPPSPSAGLQEGDRDQLQCVETTSGAVGDRKPRRAPQGDHCTNGEGSSEST